MFAGLDRAGRGESRADAFGPGRVLALWDLEADLDVFSGIIAAGADALDDLGDQVLIPIDFLGQISDDRDGVIKEADRAGVFVLSAARVDGALGVAMGDCPIDPVLEPLGGLQIASTTGLVTIASLRPIAGIWIVSGKACSVACCLRTLVSLDVLNIICPRC